MSQSNDLREETHHQWIHKMGLAQGLIPAIGELYYTKNVITTIHGRSLINQSPIDILKLHRFARQIDDYELDINQTAPLIHALTKLNIDSISLDIALLLHDYTRSGKTDLDDYLKQVLADEISDAQPSHGKSTDIVLYGFGRIGRLLARILIQHTGRGDGLRLRAIVVRKSFEEDIIKRASLLRRDSVHGLFDGTITVDKQANTITANGNVIQIIYSNDPSEVDYTSYGINNAIIVDNTGRWRDETGLQKHLEAPGASRVLLTAPGKGNIKNVVYGINHDTITTDTIVSAASCTTNAIVPVLKVINDTYTIVNGHVETVHSYTNDQNLIDNLHKGNRRGRSAALNMVLTETGAASAVAKALPELEGKLSGNAIRVPTPNVSMAILNLTIEKATDKDTVNSLLRNISLNSSLRQQIDFTDSPEVVSTDFVGTKTAGIVDGTATISNGQQLVLYVWYDNEYGYSSQVVRVLEEMAEVKPKDYPERVPVERL